MDLFTWVSKETAVVRAQERQHISTVVHMMGSGVRIRNMGWGNSNTSTRLNITDNGKMTLEKVTGHTTIQMATVTRVSGTEICKMALELITTQMAIFTRESG